MRSTIRLSLAVLTGCLLAFPGQSQDAAAKKKKIAQAADAAWQSQDWQEAAEVYANLVEVDPENGEAWHHLGYALHAIGKYDAALKAHVKATEFPKFAPTATYNVACIYAIEKDKDNAFEWLKKAAKVGFRNTDHMAGDSDMDNLRDDPRYEKIVAAMDSTAASAPSFQAFTGTTERANQRLAYFSQSGSPGQLAIDYGQAAWKDSYSELVDSEKFTNRRWRLGRDFWTTLDTNVPISVAGTKIPAGQYYLTLEHKGDGRFVLAFNDPDTVRQKKLDGFVAHLTEGGIEVEMKHEEVDEVAEKLEISVKVSEDQNTKGKLKIHFGPHELTAPLDVHLGNGKSEKKAY